MHTAASVSCAADPVKLRKLASPGPLLRLVPATFDVLRQDGYGLLASWLFRVVLDSQVARLFARRQASRGREVWACESPGPQPFQQPSNSASLPNTTYRLVQSTLLHTTTPLPPTDPSMFCVISRQFWPFRIGTRPRPGLTQICLRDRPSLRHRFSICAARVLAPFLAYTLC